ncbi:MAG: arsenate reductase [Halothiobacillus sp.]|nr:arsenate reductase [Halothiobacillus sp.]
MMTVYGIPQCSTVKKTRDWLDTRGLAYLFHDYKKHGVPETLLDAWIAAFGWETVINRRGTSWRGLSETTRTAMDAASAKVEALHNPSLIKRPILVTENTTLIGFDPESWHKALS